MNPRPTSRKDISDKRVMLHLSSQVGTEIRIEGVKYQFKI